ncbi:hypothetical protein CH339_11100 [Rhodobium orientis]|uniref:OmpA-like domain-containing protein n=1 Tax=Rhodobium orientis TaxID=34017 RepID=A0A327JN54_9HYPH|nr:hypothetical protein [Rhodobium orientis]RAI27145.1 hypothetical protein CH339_11100 [Rhodobium orientis]
MELRRRRFEGRRGRPRFYRSRRVYVVDRRYRNRFRRGRSVYYLPPRGADIAAAAFVIGASAASAAVIYDALSAPPVVEPPRRYTLDEIVEDPEVRHYVRAVDVDTINFASGESEITPTELGKLDNIAGGIQRVVKNDPGALFLIEGHTDAVGDEESNLVLSEDRALAVKVALVEEYGIDESNLEVAGYGEQYLKIDTDGPSHENRRVTVRNISNLIAQGSADDEAGSAESDEGFADDQGEDFQDDQFQDDNGGGQQ